MYLNHRRQRGDAREEARAQRLKVTLLFLEGCLECLQSLLNHTHLLCAASGEGVKGEGGEGEGGGEAAGNCVGCPCVSYMVGDRLPDTTQTSHSLGEVTKILSLTHKCAHYIHPCTH